MVCELQHSNHLARHVGDGRQQHGFAVDAYVGVLLTVSRISVDVGDVDSACFHRRRAQQPLVDRNARHCRVVIVGPIARPQLAVDHVDHEEATMLRFENVHGDPDERRDDSAQVEIRADGLKEFVLRYDLADEMHALKRRRGQRCQRRQQRHIRVAEVAVELVENLNGADDLLLVVEDGDTHHRSGMAPCTLVHVGVKETMLRHVQNQAALARRYDLANDSRWGEETGSEVGAQDVELASVRVDHDDGASRSFQQVGGVLGDGHSHRVHRR
mmetsp:Transcript_545/g.1073  ORF Transcript_545/g.1073 Transcript_545/m.1073 type:complete len:271 (-) Transcript_545:19-831(-)